MNYKKIFNYDNFHKHKLEYIIIILFTALIGYTIYIYLKKKYNHKHYEAFQTNNIDILLGEGRQNLSDGIHNTQLQIVYNDIDTINNNNLFIVYRVKLNTNKTNKYLGDLITNNISVENSNNLIDIIKTKTNPHILNPIFDNDSNSKKLTYNNDIDKNIIIIKSFDINNTSYNLFNKLDLIDNKNNLNYDFKKITQFLNNNETINVKVIDSNNIYFEIKDLLSYNKNTISNYLKNTLIPIRNYFETEFIKKLKEIINIKKNELQNLKVEVLSENNEQRVSVIPGGYEMISPNYVFELLKEENENTFYDKIYNNKDIDATLRNNIIQKSRIHYELLYINGEIIKYPFLIFDTIYDINNNISSKFNQYITTNFDDNIKNIYNKLNQHIIDLNNIINLEINKLEIPLKIIRTKKYSENDTHMTFGDIIQTNYNDSIDISLLNNYVKVPLRCCRKIEPEIKYSNQFPIKILKDINNKEYEIYKHPLYNTFRIFLKDNEQDNIEKQKPLYEIIPCSKTVNNYSNKINNYKKLKEKCNNISILKASIPLTNNSFNQLQLNTQINEINENEKTLNTLRKSLNNLQREIDRKSIIKTEYNRAKLQNYNDEKSVLINKLTKKLSNNNMDINIFYTDKIIEYLKQQCKNENIVFCKKSGVKKELVNKLENLEKEIKESKSNDSTIIPLTEEDKKEKLIKIIQECPNLDGLIHKSELNKCYQCNLNN